MPIPDFFIVGAFKSGTTALYDYLRLHPQVFMPFHKEPLFFGDDLSAADAAKALELIAIAALPFTQSAPRSDEELRTQAAALAKAGASRVMLRDEAGLLTADRLATLLPALRAGLASTPLDLHLRCQTALGPMIAGTPRTSAR